MACHIRAYGCRSDIAGRFKSTQKGILLLIAAIIAFCVLLFLVAILAPRISQHMERGGQKPLGMGQRGASKAPGPLGRWFSKPFSKSQKAVGKSGSKGRETRGKLPF